MEIQTPKRSRASQSSSSKDGVKLESNTPTNDAIKPTGGSPLPLLDEGTAPPLKALGDGAVVATNSHVPFCGNLPNLFLAEDKLPCMQWSGEDAVKGVWMKEPSGLGFAMASFDGKVYEFPSVLFTELDGLVIPVTPPVMKKPAGDGAHAAVVTKTIRPLQLFLLERPKGMTTQDGLKAWRKMSKAAKTKHGKDTAHRRLKSA